LTAEKTGQHRRDIIKAVDAMTQRVSLLTFAASANGSPPGSRSITIYRYEAGRLDFRICEFENLRLDVPEVGETQPGRLVVADGSSAQFNG
jgi:hypothetical protein